jgi:hypothetical protein
LTILDALLRFLGRVVPNSEPGPVAP